MAKVIAVTLNRHANAGSYILGLGCSLITGSGNELSVDEKVTLSFGSQQTYVNGTQISRISDYQNTYALCAYSDNIFYWQEWDSSSRRGVFVYEKINDKCYYGYDGNGTNWSSYPSFYNIESIYFADTEDPNSSYSHSVVLNYTNQLGSIDYTPSILFHSGYASEIDSNLLACSIVNSNKVITFNGANYFSLGTNTIVPIDSN